MSDLIQLDTISQLHQILGLESPMHPLVSVIPIDEHITNFDYGDASYVLGFYQITLKSGISGHISYGRNTYDFQEGTMMFTRPAQAMSFKNTRQEKGVDGWILMFHPDLIRNSDLGVNIEKYNFFSYAAHEALHVSELERASLTEQVQKIERECRQSIDRHTQTFIVANIELLLNYCIRYYDRQFYVRTNLNQDVITRFENLLNEYFDSEKSLEVGLPTVKYCGEKLNMSPSYLSDLLKKETGKTAQQHIQNAIVELAKNLLLGTTESVSQIAYSLGFEYPQHFSKLFKTRTGMSPMEYRKIQ